MNWIWVLAFVIFVLVVAIKIGMNGARARQQKLNAMTDSERWRFLANEKEAADIKRGRREEFTYGKLNAAMVCPHCNEKGKIRTMPVVKKKGVSGGKATAAILTGGYPYSPSVCLVKNRGRRYAAATAQTSGRFDW